ncbi:MAG: ATPase [Limnochordaceae bacterium]|nr:ATPase [Limnochordaceae bacterium]
MSSEMSSQTHRTRATVRHLFAGSNSSVGFYSYYDFLIAPDATRILFVKGGPGVGKSTFMRQIGEHFAAQGWPVEYCHCSSDPRSLDGVIFPHAGIALIDGTAPHMQDPRFPGAVDEIIHLGDFWDEAALMRAKKEIVSLTRQASRLFAQAYRYLGAARLVLADRETLASAAMDFALVNRWRQQIIHLWQLESKDATPPLTANQSADSSTHASPSQSVQAGFDHHVPLSGGGTPQSRVRKLFATAITPEGLKSFLPELFGDARQRVILQGEPGTGKSTLVAAVAQACTWAGFDVELFYDALEPTHPEHLWVPRLNVGLVTSNEYHPFSAKANDVVLDFNQGLDYTSLASCAEELEYDRVRFQELLQRGLQSLARAKHVHDDLEAYYVPNMRFSAVEELLDKTVTRIHHWAEAARKELRCPANI